MEALHRAVIDAAAESVPAPDRHFKALTGLFVLGCVIAEAQSRFLSRPSLLWSVHEADGTGMDAVI